MSLENIFFTNEQRTTNNEKDAKKANLSCSRLIIAEFNFFSFLVELIVNSVIQQLSFLNFHL